MPLFASFPVGLGRMVVLGTLSAVVFPSGAVQAEQVSDNYSFALMFLKRSYPLAEEQRLVAFIAPEFEISLDRQPRPLTSFAIVVHRPAANPAVDANLGPLVFRASFRFDSNKRFQSFVNAGNDFVSTAKVLELNDISQRPS